MYRIANPWKWNFWDGMYSTAKNPVHRYSKTGKYTVYLTVKDIKDSNTNAMSDMLHLKINERIKLTNP